MRMLREFLSIFLSIILFDNFDGSNAILDERQMRETLTESGYRKNLIDSYLAERRMLIAKAKQSLSGIQFCFIGNCGKSRFIQRIEMADEHLIQKPSLERDAAHDELASKNILPIAGFSKSLVESLVNMRNDFRQRHTQNSQSHSSRQFGSSSRNRP